MALYARSRAMSTVSKSKIFKTNPYWDEKEGLDFEARNKKFNRPLSPSLSAYNFQNNMVVSMGHRITGMALYAMLFAIAAGAVFSPAAFPHYIGMLADLHPSPVTTTALKFLLVYPFASHVTSGIRHLISDSGYWLTIKGVRTTGWVVIGISAIFSLYLATL